MRALLPFVFLFGALPLAACGSGGDTGGGDAGVDGGDAGSDGGDVAPRVCGPAKPCHPGEFCDYPDGQCGEGALRGFCETSPTSSCGSGLLACGCDGTVGEVCDGAVGLGTGVDVALPTACSQPAGTFVCGAYFCDPTMQYCDSETDLQTCDQDYTCAPLPDDCATAPTCDCVAMALAYPTCTGDADGGITAVAAPGTSPMCP